MIKGVRLLSVAVVALAASVGVAAAVPAGDGGHVTKPGFPSGVQGAPLVNQLIINTKSRPLVLNWVGNNGARTWTRRPKTLGFYSPNLPYPLVAKLRWSGWNRPVATGVGMIAECGPRWRNGEFVGDWCRQLRAHVRLTRIALDGCGEGKGAYIYTRFTVRVPKAPRNNFSGRMTIC